MEMRIVTVTPDMAKSFLQFNYKGNRKVRTPWVKDLASRIKRGEWRLTHQGILFDKSGNLIDGQHRCHAIVEANQAVDLVVVHGAEEDAYKVLDQGQKRSLADLSGLDRRVAPVITHLSYILVVGRVPTFIQQEPLIDGQAGEITKELIAYCGAARARVSSTPIKAAAVAVIMAGEDKEYVFKTYKAMVSRDYASLPPIALQFIKQLDSGKISLSGGSAQKDAFCRAYVIFQQEYANKKLVMSEAISNNIQGQVKSVLEASIR